MSLHPNAVSDGGKHDPFTDGNGDPAAFVLDWLGQDAKLPAWQKHMRAEKQLDLFQGFRRICAPLALLHKNLRQGK